MSNGSIIDYSEIRTNYPWIIEKKRNAILSPDSDGILCGLFMSHFFDWEIVGFYDGKILLLKDGLEVEDCIFLDIELYRQKIRSIGHHILIYDINKMPPAWNWGNFDNCIQPNLIRQFDRKNTFNRKYPLATIHLLMAILQSQVNIAITKNSICPLYFVDGTYQVLFSYPENVFEWLNFLDYQNTNSVLNKIFIHSHYTVHDMMRAMDDFFKKRDKICPEKGGKYTRERGDRLVFSDSRTHGPVNCVNNGNLYSIDTNPVTVIKKTKPTRTIDSPKQRIEDFLNLLSGLTGWTYKQNDWTYNELRCFEFNKRIETPGLRRFNNVISQNPVSWAITSTDKKGFQYTLDNNNIFTI